MLSGGKALVLLPRRLCVSSAIERDHSVVVGHAAVGSARVGVVGGIRCGSRVFLQQVVDRERTGEFLLALFVMAAVAVGERRRRRRHRRPRIVAVVRRVRPTKETSPTATEHPVGERVLARRVDGPVVVLTPRARRISQHLREAFVQRQVVANRVAPARVVAVEEIEPLAQVFVDFRQRQLLGRRVLDRHCDEGDVGVGRLRMPLILLRLARFRRLIVAVSRRQLLTRGHSIVVTLAYANNRLSRHADCGRLGDVCLYIPSTLVQVLTHRRVAKS